VNVQSGVPTAPAVVVPSFSAETATPNPKRQRRQSSKVPVSAPVVEDQRQLTLEATTTLTAPTGAELDVDAEIEAAKQMVMNLKRELQLKNAAGESLEDLGFDVGDRTRGTKRSNNEDSGVSVSSGSLGDKRVIVKSKRVEQSIAQTTGRRVVWGMFIFGLGAAAA
jgi:dihydroxyacid dehydratase/phosphogluconate dehydratase